MKSDLLSYAWDYSKFIGLGYGRGWILWPAFGFK